MTLSELALQIANSHNGVQEIPRGSNSGPDVNQYLKSAGLTPGYPWCMAFVYYCVDQACKELDIPNPLLKTGGALREWDETTCRKLTIRDSALKPGDIFIMAFGGGTGHAGFVEKIVGGLIYTIEGNTNQNGSREGYEVAQRQRILGSFHGFIQLPE